MGNHFISKVKLKKTGKRPVVVKFENGALKRGKEKNVACNLFKHETGRTVAALATRKMIYTGEVDTENDLHNNYLVIKSKKTGQLKVIAIDHVILSPMLNAKATILGPKVTNFDLKKEFGSKRTQRQIEQYNKMKMNVENVKQDLEKTVANATIDESPIVPSVPESNEITPPINREAQKVEYVYDLEDFIPTTVLNSLDKCVKQLFDEEYGTTDFLPLHKLKIENLKLSEAPDRELKCKILLYLDALIRFNSEPIKVIDRKSYKVCFYSEEIGQHILQTFTLQAKNHRLRPTSMKDKCLCYALVLYLIVNDYKLAIDSLTSVCKTSTKKLQELLRILGCHIYGNEAVLKLPLAPQRTFIKKGRRNK